ncbi:MAG: NAD-dependent protein deacetylase [Kineosporiaceae bacterium]
MGPTTADPAPEQAPPRSDVAALAELVARGGVSVLSGAGLSTESGIPDYRGPSGALRTTLPMTFQEFTRKPQARQRYWARSHLGWQRMREAAPNAGHRAVAALQAAGLVDGVVTQNVDGLHTAAGAHDVVELHGALSRVVCLDCGRRTARAELDARLREANPGWDADRAGLRVNPDGDAHLDDDAVAGFAVVPCLACAGVLKPDVVFFGESVPPAWVAAACEAVDAARSLLVLGSSLTVYSGRRFVVRAADRGIPVAIVTQGATRADALAAVRLDAPLGATLQALTGMVGVRPGT